MSAQSTRRAIRERLAASRVDGLVETKIRKAMRTSTGRTLPPIEIGILDPETGDMYDPDGVMEEGPGYRIEKSAFRRVTTLGLDNAPQPKQQLGDEEVQQFSDSDGIIPPPWPPDLLQVLMAEDTMHGICIQTKAADCSFDGWDLELRPETKRLLKENVLTQEELDEDRATVENFLLHADGKDAPIEDVLYGAAIDYNGVGYLTLEARRNRFGMLAAVNQVPAYTIRVLNRGDAQQKNIRAAYLQKVDQSTAFYLAYGEAVQYGLERQPTDPLHMPMEEFPRGEEARKKFVRWNKDALCDSRTGKKVSEEEWDRRATELIFVPRKPMTRSRTYGTPSGIQALGAITAQKLIDKYNVDFFGSKGVPQVAVILEGLPRRKAAAIIKQADGSTVDLRAQIRAKISEYFKSQLGTDKRKVLFITLYDGVKIRFEKLSKDSIDASFHDYEKRNLERIRLAHRVPPAALGIQETANLGGGRDTAQLKRYNEHVVRPGKHRLERIVNDLIRRGLLIPWFDFKFQPMDLDELEKKREFGLRALQMGGFSLNMFLEAVGKPQIDHPAADIHYLVLPGKVMPVGKGLSENVEALLQQQEKNSSVVKAIVQEVADAYVYRNGANGSTSS